MAAQLRQAFLDAQDYEQHSKDYQKTRRHANRDQKPEPRGPPSAT